MTFRLNTQRVALTYPQCNIGKDKVMEALLSLSQTPDKVIVAEEHHQDGSIHYHCYLQRDSKFSTRNERYFDIVGHHPNIKKEYINGEGKRYSVDEGWIEYLLKEDTTPVFTGWDSLEDIRI